VRRALTRFTLFGLLSLGLVGLTSFHLFGAIAEERALESAKEAGANLSRRLLAPYATEAFVAGDSRALERMDTVAKGRMRDGTVARIKIWTEDGRVLYSDEAALIGRRFTMEAGVDSLPADRPGVSFVSDVDDDEHAFEDPDEELVETYTKVTVPTGQRLVFEVYYPAGVVDVESRSLLGRMAPVGLAGLAVVFLAQLPLAVQLARRLQHGRRERQRLLAQSVAAVAKEREQVASDLHDDAIQDLATVALRLDALEPELPEHLREPVRSVTATVRRDIGLLRDIVTALFPVRYAAAGLAGAVADLAEPLRDQGIEVVLLLDEDVEAPPVVGELLYRVARESVANVLAHAHATRVTLSLTATDEDVVLAVVDDGVGFTPTSRESGHVGLMLSVEAIEGLGGSVVVRSAPGHGTTVRATAPLTRSL
jgi:signal transduction histidine kinase